MESRCAVGVLLLLFVRCSFRLSILLGLCSGNIHIQCVVFAMRHYLERKESSSLYLFSVIAASQNRL